MTFKEAKEHLEEIEVEDKLWEENEPVPCLGDYYAETFNMAKLALDEMIAKEEELMMTIERISLLKDGIENFIDDFYCNQGNDLTKSETNVFACLNKSCEALEELAVEYTEKLSK